MLKKLTLDGLKADYANVEKLLLSRNLDNDPIGHIQLENRKKNLSLKIESVKNTPEHKAGIALFFTGTPVVGSRGIKVDFAGRFIGLFQDLVAKQFAAEEIGDIGLRGPVPLKQNSDLLMTDIARGSVGVVLEEADQNEAIVDTQLKVVVNHVAEAIAAAANPEPERFDELIEKIDYRFLNTLSNIFSLLDDEGATTRIVEGEQDFQLDAYSIKRARERTSTTHIEERDGEDFKGKLFLLPAHKKFELVQAGTGGTIYGAVSGEFAKGKLQELLSAGDVAGHNWIAKLKTRKVTRPNREPKITFTLVGLVEKVAD